MNCLLVALLLSQPSPPGGGYGIFTPAGPHNLAGQCLYFHQVDDSDTYLYRSAADEVTQTCGGVAIFVCNASGCDLAGELGSVSSLDATTESTIETAIDTLNNVASIGSTTESTIEAAIDTLANLTSVQGQSVSLSGGLTVESASTINQDLTTDANVQFSQVTVGNTGLVVGASTPFSDSSGILTFQNIDALDSTTETTIESAIDTLPNLVYPPSTTITCSGDAASVNWALYTSAIVDFGDEGVAGCTITFSNMAAGRAIYLKVIQDGDGGNATFAGCTFHWPSTSPVITPIDNAYDLISCFSFDGSTCDCSIIQDMK